MGKRKGQKSSGNYVKKKRNRVIIYSSDEDSNNSVTSDREPVPGLPHVVECHVATPSSVRRDSRAPSESVPTAEPAAEATPEAITEPEIEVMNSVEETEVDLDDELLLLLGEAPEPETTLGKAVHKDVASRWMDILKKGLSKEVRDKMDKEYLVPSNCELLVPPVLNPEAKAALTEPFVKRDASLMFRQKQISNAMGALAQAVEVIISNKCDQELKQKILKPVNDACRIMCNMHHNETKIRRKFVISSVNSGMRETLMNSGTDKFLFGDNMSEKLKLAKNVQKSGEALKVPQKSAFHKSNFYKQNNSNKNRSNYKPLHQKLAGKQDAGKEPFLPRRQNSSSAYQRRARERSPVPRTPSQHRQTSRR